MSQSQGFNVNEVIQQSTSDVPLAELAKKGFKRVKVLNKDTINNLIAEAVNRVISERLAESTVHDREKIQAEAKQEFDKLLGQQKQTSRELDEYQREIARLQKDLRDREDRLRSYEGERATDNERVAQYQERMAILEVEARQLRESVQQRDSELGELRQKSSSGDMQALQDGIEKLSRRIATGSGPGVVDIPEGKAAELAIGAMLSSVGDDPVESNVNQVNVKKTKAGGVSGTLAKLRSMKKGGS